ncbi:IcmT/TraK family protein [Facilibium subflavum]|uniref:IcmT/TraK family protein n=1 Tax=Facilibium subflavum TaxID=2219058 RepID=UPI000E645FE2|nr:IcmT/TraK family protein [Facilibium subflavum]
MSINTSTHWRDSSRTPVLFFIDARVFIFIAISFFHFRAWTLTLDIIMVIFFVLLYRLNISLTVFARMFRTLLFGKKKIKWRRL